MVGGVRATLSGVIRRLGQRAPWCDSHEVVAELGAGAGCRRDDPVSRYWFVHACRPVPDVWVFAQVVRWGRLGISRNRTPSYVAQHRELGHEPGSASRRRTWVFSHPGASGSEDEDLPPCTAVSRVAGGFHLRPHSLERFERHVPIPKLHDSSSESSSHVNMPSREVCCGAVHSLPFMREA
jgi:hypothetical protein